MLDTGSSHADEGTQTPSISLTRPEDWKYIAEGNATIAFTYTGPDSNFREFALRLRKTNAAAPKDVMREPNSGIGLTAGHTRSDTLRTPRFTASEEGDHACKDLAFHSQVIARLLPNECLPRIKTVKLERGWLESLHALEGRTYSRPAARKSVGGIDVCADTGVLATDLVGSAPLAVEIKPKWGFLPSTSKWLSRETAPVKTTTCRYCMHSCLKLHGRDSNSRSFCPLDLYSRDEERVTRAISALWDEWAADDASFNNLRIFAEGKPVRPNDHNSLARLAQVLGYPKSNLTGFSCLKDVFCSALVPLVLTTAAFSTLAELQRSLDVLDIEGLLAIHKRAALSISDLAEPTIGDWNAFVDTYTSGFRTWNHENPAMGNAATYRLAYTLSATFKDCSVILQPHSTTPASDTRGCAAVIDLGVKPLSRLQEWASKDRKIALFYAEHVPETERRTCIDNNRKLRVSSRCSNWRADLADIFRGVLRR
ncbi:hypothetical protein CONPUDRAFT_134729 [Coniophora puteana RWD-64-598 SS2]|uniref:Inositol-pentakisphosphate 2-kinase n=1 Tax=Coniophora puteana (strain RWD-64-598) TaxID=741705 RepID=A0A5M3N0R0_CONPW|nr:uncharacterized protein CONPUDRAFT_134729 [Coniophora puteana RWD-64-598 SS2]EIW84866.1 hypothetical protein CONPUDRAFT_134729 [Coniophora puteana RWD-64-598 SS2]